MRYESVNIKESAGLDPAALSPANPREKWLRKRTQVKLRVCAGWGHIRVGTVASGGGAAPGGLGVHPAGQAFIYPSELTAHTGRDSGFDEGHGAVGRGWGL